MPSDNTVIATENTLQQILSELRQMNNRQVAQVSSRKFSRPRSFTSAQLETMVQESRLQEQNEAKEAMLRHQTEQVGEAFGKCTTYELRNLPNHLRNALVARFGWNNPDR